MFEFSDYLIFVDESGDHGLTPINAQFPVFVLVFIVIKKEDYVQTVAPAFQNLKMKYWGHDQIVFHENDIRKEKGDFAILRTSAILRSNFMKDLAKIIETTPFQYFASVIQKEKLIQQYCQPLNPYETSLLFCMEHVLNFLTQHNQKGKQSHIIIEKRGAKEDKELELEFRRICDNNATWGYKPIDFKQVEFDIRLVDKKANSSGLQLADLIARPIALQYLRPSQKNHTYDILKKKNKGTTYFP